jgi:hypothetical protein
MGSSGEQSLVFNPQEKALSSDMERLQAFHALDLNEIFRWLLDVNHTTDDGFAGGATAIQSVSVETPLRGEVLGGLLVRPAVGSTDLTVDPGMAFVIDVDAVADAEASPYRYLRDPGIPAAGTLAIDASTNGGIRIDVIECQRVSGGYAVLETDNRDIFNTSTGLFNAVSVNKVIAGRLQYRVRKGVDGGGFPGVVSGWLPLAVASVPNGSVNNDTVTFWDVRPLVSDRVRSPFRIPFDDNGVDAENQINCATLTSASGTVRAHIGGRRIGGALGRGTPHATPVLEEYTLDVTSAENQEPGFGAVASHPWYLYILTPFGLPRWAMYVGPAFAPRQPRSPIGIPVVSTHDSFTDGSPQTPIALPASTGLLGSTSKGVVVGAGYFDGAATMRGFYGDGVGGSYLTTQGTTGILVAPTSADATKASYSFVAGTHFPSAAKMILVQFLISLTATAGGLVDVEGQLQTNVGGTGTNFYANTRAVMGRFNAGDAITAFQTLWVPVHQFFPRHSFGGNTYNFDMFYGMINGTFVTASAQILGWRI